MNVFKKRSWQAMEFIYLFRPVFRVSYKKQALHFEEDETARLSVWKRSHAFRINCKQYTHEEGKERKK